MPAGLAQTGMHGCHRPTKRCCEPQALLVWRQQAGGCRSRCATASARPLRPAASVPRPPAASGHPSGASRPPCGASSWCSSARRCAPSGQRCWRAPPLQRRRSLRPRRCDRRACKCAACGSGAALQAGRWERPLPAPPAAPLMPALAPHLLPPGGGPVPGACGADPPCDQGGEGRQAAVLPRCGERRRRHAATHGSCSACH